MVLSDNPSEGDPTNMRYVNELAIFGGQPAFAHALHVGRPNLCDRSRLQERIDEIFDRNWLTNNGPFVREFEHRIAEIIGVKHCIAMCNATIALEIAIRALKMTGEVIVPSLTFVATAHALQWQQITPVFCDVDPRTYTIDPARIRELITPRTSGIIGVHLWGRPCNIENINEIAKRYGLQVLYDAAHAFGCTAQGRPIGAFGDAEVLSFHATKFLNAGEGGAIVTNNDELAEKIRLMKNFGFAGQDKVIYVGTNGKMTELSAAIGLTSLESMDRFMDTNQANYTVYHQALLGIPGIRLLTYDERERCNYQYIIIEVEPSITNISRDTLIAVLRAEQVLARRYFYPGCHRMEPYRSYFPHAGLLLPETNKIVQRTIALPTGTSVGESEILTIADIIRFAVFHGREIEQRRNSSPVAGATAPVLTPDRTPAEETAC